MMKKLLICMTILLSSCAAGNYTLKGPNNAKPPQEMTPLPGETPETNYAKDAFPWVIWTCIILICLFLLVKEKMPKNET